MPLLRHHLARFSARSSTINSNRISPLCEPSHGAKSGLGQPHESASFDRFGP
jgi:hypothetical protein